MKVKVLPKIRRSRIELEKQAASLDDAYAKGYFSSGMPRDEFKERILKMNPELRFISNQFGNQIYTGIWDGNKMVGSITILSCIPRFTIAKYDASKDKKLHYANEHGERTYKDTVNNDEEKGKILCRSWIAVFNELERKGYKIADQDIDY